MGTYASFMKHIIKVYVDTDNSVAVSTLFGGRTWGEDEECKGGQMHGNRRRLDFGW